MLREKTMNALKRCDDAYIPFDLKLCPSLYKEFKVRTGMENYQKYYGFPAREVQVEFTGNKDRYKRYFIDPENIMIDDWGVGFRSGSVAHFTEMQHPMANFATMEEFMEYPYPDPVSEYNWDCLKEKVEGLTGNDLVSFATMDLTIFEMAWYLRGMSNFLVDMATNEELATFHLDRITERRCKGAKLYVQSGIDILRLGDDVSTQLDMMMSPEMWRKYLKPRLASVIKAAKEENPDILLFYHGDGNLQKIIPDLIDIGVDILNPIQPECMNPVEIKRLYGDKLSFWGTVGTQTTMPFGTPGEVRECCSNMIKEVGKGGGLLIAPTHMIEPEVSWENIEAFIETIREYNKRGTGCE